MWMCGCADVQMCGCADVRMCRWVDVQMSDNRSYCGLSDFTAFSSSRSEQFSVN